MFSQNKFLCFFLFLLSFAFFSQAQAEVLSYDISIKDHRFVPSELKVASGKKIKLIVHNQDATPEEFESSDLKREKIVPAGARVSVFFEALKPGRYRFFGEFHEDTAVGFLVVE